MTRLRITVIAVGASLMLVGAVGWVITSVGDDTDTEAAAPAATALTTVDPTTVPSAPPTTSPDATSTAPIVAASSATTTVATTAAADVDTTAITAAAVATTTGPGPTPSPEQAAEFVAEFAGAIAAGDTEFLLDRLHPVVFEIYTSQACRTLIEDEILMLTGYRAEGPGQIETQRFTIGGDEVTLEVMVVPVSFGFGGQQFEVEGSFALVDGETRWFARCE